MNPKGALILAITIVAFLSVCLGLMWLQHPGNLLSGRRVMTRMETARNADTSNLDNVLQF
jgi:hypothetical protein